VLLTVSLILSDCVGMDDLPYEALNAPFCRHINHQDDSNMLYALTWFLVFGLLALWSLAAWAMQAAAVWAATNAGALTGAASGAASAAEDLLLPEWLAPWVPPEVAQALTSLLSGLAPAVESLLQATPALAGGLTVASWVLWGIGTALLILLGAGLHVLISMWRRRGGGSGPHPTGRVAA
jgi:hypothetical protein